MSDLAAKPVLSNMRCAKERVQYDTYSRLSLRESSACQKSPALAYGGINVFAEMGVDLRIDYPVLDTIRGYVNDSESTQSRAPPSENGGVKYSQDSNKTPIELSDISALSERIGNKRGSERYNIIRDFILEELAEQPITLSDGRKAIVDKSDAKHIASRSWNKKTAEISQIKQIVENAELVAEESSTKEKKFSHYYYYEAPVKYNNDVFNIYLNVGVAQNDKTNHIYDITQKLRDTAQHIAVGRLSKSFALGSGISNKSISENSENVNTKFSQEPMTLKQLEAENKKLKKQLEYWRNQTRKNPKKTVREGDVKKLAKAIVESVATDLKPHEMESETIKDMLRRKGYRVAGELEGVKTHLELDRRRKKLEYQGALAKRHFEYSK